MSKTRTRPFGPPLYIALGISARCNYKCLYCDVWLREDRRELRTEEWKKLIEELAGWLGPVHISIAGGEPFLRKDLGEIVSHAHSVGLFPSIVTNGALLTTSMIQEVISWPLISLILSIDSLSPGPHDEMHGSPGAHAKAMTAALEMVKLGFGPKLKIASVLTGTNIEEMENLARWVSENKIGGFSVQPFGEPFERVHDPEWYSKSPLKISDPAHVAHVAQTLKRGKEREGWPVQNPNRQLDALPLYYEDPEQGIFLPCLVGSTSLGIGPAGDLRFCPYFPPFGEQGEGNLREQWYGEKAANMRSRILKCQRGCSIMNCNFAPTLAERVSRWRTGLRNLT